MLDLLIQAVIGGTAEALTGAGIERGPGLALRIQRTVALVEQTPPTVMEAAIRRAVDASIREVRQQYRDELFSGDATKASADLLALLDHPPFAEELTRKLLYRGQPDFPRLAEAYLHLPPERRSQRWDALELPLLDLFDAIERHLQSDPQVGGLVQGIGQLAALTHIAQGTDLIAAASQQIQSYQVRIAAAGEETAAGIAGLLAAAGRQEASLSEIVKLLVAGQTAGPRAHPPAPDPAEKRAAAAEERYLRLLRRECNRLPLAEENRDTGGQTQTHAQLSNVYVDLQTESRPSLEQIFDRLAVPLKDRPALTRQLRQKNRAGAGRGMEEAADLLHLPGDRDDWKKHPLHPYAADDNALGQAFAPLTALEVLAAQPHTVLLGDPGSGKSTFVNHLAYVLAGAALGEESEWRAAIHDAFDAPLFPLRVILRRWSAGLDTNSRAGLPLAYAALAAATELDQAALERRLALPHCLVLFDGLDEAPAANPDDPTAPDRRRLIVESVQAFCTAHPGCRVLVTSRVKPYEQGSVRLEGLPAHTLAPLDDSRVRRFVTNWYGELARIDPERAERAERAESRLQVALKTRPALRQMAGTPLLLTMLAAVNIWAGLPESRAQLYDNCVEQLLWEWEKKERGAPAQGEEGRAALGLVDLLREEGVSLQRADVERVLWELTFRAHTGSGAETADLHADALRKELAAIHPRRNEGWAWANRVVELMAERGGLLVESETGVFTFPHRSFQEYLAARWLLTDTERAAKAAQLAEADAWQEVILLACGYLTWQGRREDVQALILEVTAGDAFATAEARRRLLTGGVAWLEYNSPPRATGAIGRLLTEDIPPKLTALMQQRDAPPAQRLEAGILLADLNVLPPDLDGFVPIAAADSLGYDFKIGKYQVTNAQFRRFFDAGGYDLQQSWWNARWIKELDGFWRESWRSGPRYWDDERFNKSTQPVVGVSWYEAAAYCIWLTDELRATGQIGQNEVARLPKEAEWMFVAAPPVPPSNSPHAGGRTDGSDDGGREYAWGNGFEAWRVNSKESGYGRPTPVHMHPGGATPDTGVWDLCGNVWEWGQEDSSFGKMLLGGAYYSDADGDLTPSSRVRSYPRHRGHDLGFRLVVVPSSHG